MIYGLKTNFALEFKTVTENFGFIRIWLNDFCIGLWESTYLKPVILSLNRIADYSDCDALDLKINTPKKIFDQILDNEDVFENTLLGFGESFDPFEIRAYSFQGNVVFLWRLNRKITDDRALNKYKPWMIYSAIVNQESYNAVLAEMER